MALGLAQTLAWASSYYLPAILAAPMARDLGLSVPTVFAAFSVALVVSALPGPFAGQAIDRFGGRPVLMVTNLIFAAGLCGLGLASGPITMFAAWVVLGVGMGSGLYEAAFSALVKLWGHDSRGASPGSHCLLDLRAPWAGRFPAIWRHTSDGELLASRGRHFTSVWACR